MELSSYLTYTGHSCHPAVAEVWTVLLTLFREEEIDLVVVSHSALHTLSHQRRAHKVSLYMGAHNTLLIHGALSVEKMAFIPAEPLEKPAVIYNTR